MKKLIKYSLIALVTLGLFNACENDGGSSVLELEDGAVINVVNLATSDPFINLLRLELGEVIEIQFSANVAQGNPVSTDITAAYTKASGEAYTAILFQNVTLPQEFSFSTNDIVNSFDGINSAADIGLGDVLSFSARFTMADGRVLDLIDLEDGSNNTGTNIQFNSSLYNARLDYPISCPSDLGGTYLVTSSATGCCGVAPITDYEYVVTVTDNGGGSYSLSDYSGGIYDGLFCGPFGICGDASSGDITDVCGTLSGSAADCCGGTITFEGTVDPETGVWTVETASGFMQGTQTWTKQ